MGYLREIYTNFFLIKIKKYTMIANINKYYNLILNKHIKINY